MMDVNYYDYLTGLPTMTYFFETAAAIKEKITKQYDQPVLLFLNLSGMKVYNQKQGFSAGNDFLKAFSETLTKYFDKENCCRLGGVHFAAISGEKQAKDTVYKFLDSCKLLDPTNVIFPHVGIYQYSTEDVSINMACDRAKLACDALKNDKTAGLAYYDLSIRHADENHRYIVENLSKALSERWITVYYQPIVRAVNAKICDEEALARWIDPVKGFLSPADFIPILEEEKLIYKVDLYVVERVLEKMKYMESKGYPIIPQSINLSRSDFESCDIVEEIRSRVDLAGISRSMLSIEITESIIGSDFDFMMKQILRFKELGFPVWMDDFGSGYSSLNVLKEIPFDLIKFDMSFMRQFNAKNNGKIILAELMKMAFSIDVDTVCEGVETEEQIQFLREVGCSKIQGFYYGKPTPLELILQNISEKRALDYENPDETHYYETIGRVNLQDLTAITYGNEKDFNNVFNMLPMAILELKSNSVRFVRTNQSYRNFFRRFFNLNLTGNDIPITDVLKGSGAGFFSIVKQVSKDGNRAFIDELLPDGSVANYFIRKLAENSCAKTVALAVGVLSIRDASKGTTYANLARALAKDYFKLYYINLKTDEYTEYDSASGSESMTIENHGENFFEQAKIEIPQRIHKDDMALFDKFFSKENIIKEIDSQGTFTLTYRILTNDGSFYANLKAMRMQQNGNYIIIGVSNIDSQMKQKELLEKAQQEQIIYQRLMSLTGDYIALYVVDPTTEEFTEYSSASIYGEYNLPKHGKDFFAVTRKNAEKALHPDDIAGFQKVFTLENVLHEIEHGGLFTFHGRLILGGKAQPYSVRVSMVKEKGENKLIVGTRLSN